MRNERFVEVNIPRKFHENTHGGVGAKFPSGLQTHEKKTRSDNSSHSR